MAQFEEGGLTIEEIAIKELRLKISDIISTNAKFDDDFYLLQWLKVKKLDPGRADSMIRKSLKWRQQVNVYSKMEDQFPAEHIEKFRTIFSETKDGTPIAYMNLGAMNFQMGLTAYGTAKWIQLWSLIFVQCEERMISFNKTRNANTKRITSDCTSGIVGFINVKDFAASQLLHLEVNSVFRIFFNAFKSVLAVPYLRLEVYGMDEEVWRKRLLEVVDSENLKAIESSWNPI